MENKGSWLGGAASGDKNFNVGIFQSVNNKIKTA